MDIKALGQLITTYRESGGYTYETLSAKSGVAENTLLAIEKGRGNPTVKTLEAIAKALDVKFSAEFSSKGKKNAKPMASFGPLPEELMAGLEFVAKFAGQERDIQLTAMSLIYEKTEYLKQLSPEFRARLVRLLSAAKI